MTAAAKQETKTASRSTELVVGEPIPVGALIRSPRPAAPPMELASVDEIAAAIRQRDDEQIMAALMGEVITEWFYEFEIAGKKVEGISVAGAMEFARIRAEQGFPIRFPPGSIVAEETELRGERGIRCTVVAREARTGAEGVGQAFYPWHIAKKSGDRTLDDKADRKALSVAKRNAVLDLVPEAQIKALLRERKRLIAANEARLAEEQKQAAKRFQNAPEAKRISARTSLAPRDAYGTSATEEQIETLLDLIGDTRVNAATREMVEKAISTGLEGKRAAKWIDDIRAYLEKMPPADSAPVVNGELPLG